LVVEIDGFAWHSTRDALRRDHIRQRRITLAGWTVLRYTADEVRNDPSTMLAEVAAALGC
jgi:very-short-patch-repair endonuclease